MNADSDYSWIFNSDPQNEPDNSWLFSEEHDNTFSEEHYDSTATCDPDYSWLLDDDTAVIYNDNGTDIEESDRPVSNPHGRIGKHVIYPEIVTLAKDYIENHGYTAHSRRHNEVASCGVTGPQLQTYLQQQIPGLKISLSTCRRLLLPPRKNCASAKYYKGLIQARRAPKYNREPSKIHQDLHFSRAQVSYVNELMCYFGHESLQYSVDNKNKVNVGTLAISRYHHIGAFFPTTDMPDYHDHDFPLEKFKIIPSGEYFVYLKYYYLLLE